MAVANDGNKVNIWWGDLKACAYMHDIIWLSIDIQKKYFDDSNFHWWKSSNHTHTLIDTSIHDIEIGIHKML